MALAVCLLFDARADAAVRRIWERMEAVGLTSLASHTHGRHVPHLTYASLLECDRSAVAAALASLQAQEPLPLHLDALGTFRRSRCWLAPAVTAALVNRQSAVIAALRETEAMLHKHYLPGSWTPHVTLAPRLHLTDLEKVGRIVYDVLPIEAVAERAALIDTSTGERQLLPHLI